MSTIDASQAAGASAPAEEEFHTAEVASVAMAHGVNDSFFAMVLTIQPLLMEKLALNNAQAGLFTVFLQGPSLMQPLIGHLADRRNLRWAIILTPAISAVLLTLTGLAPSYGWLAVLMLAAGFSTAGFHSVAPVLAAAKSGKKIGRGMGIFMVGGELGYSLGPLAAVAVTGALGLAGLPWLSLVGILGSLLLYLRFRNLNTQRPQHSGPASAMGPALWRMRFLMLPMMIYMFITSFLAANLVNFLPTFLSSEGAPLAFAGSAFSLVQIAGTLGVLVGSWLSDRLGQRVVLVTASVVMPVFALLFLYAPQPWWPAMLFGAGLLAFSANPAFLALIQRNFPDIRSLANGTYMASGFVIRSLVVFLVGALADQFGLRQVFTVSAWAAFLALPLVFLLPERPHTEDPLVHIA